MTTYRTTIPTPEVWQTFVQEVQGVAAIVSHNEMSVTVEIDAEDEYELAHTIIELRNTLQALTGESIDIPRPANYPDAPPKPAAPAKAAE